jgi:hypothetical protein
VLTPRSNFFGKAVRASPRHSYPTKNFFCAQNGNSPDIKKKAIPIKKELEVGSGIKLAKIAENMFIEMSVLVPIVLWLGYI